MSSRPPPPWCHQKLCFPPPTHTHTFSLALKQSGGPLQLKTRATNRLLTTLCSSPERFIINRLKYSHCGVLLRPLAPMANTHRQTQCHVVRQNDPFDRPKIQQIRRAVRNLAGWLAISIQASAGRLRMIRLRDPEPRRICVTRLRGFPSFCLEEGGCGGEAVRL